MANEPSQNWPRWSVLTIYLAKGDDCTALHDACSTVPLFPRHHALRRRMAVCRHAMTREKTRRSIDRKLDRGNGCTWPYLAEACPLAASEFASQLATRPISNHHMIRHAGISFLRPICGSKFEKFCSGVSAAQLLWASFRVVRTKILAMSKSHLTKLVAHPPRQTPTILD